MEQRDSRELLELVRNFVGVASIATQGGNAKWQLS